MIYGEELFSVHCNDFTLLQTKRKLKRIAEVQYNMFSIDYQVYNILSFIYNPYYP